MARQLRRDLLRFLQFRFVLEPPLRRHVVTKVRRRQQLALGFEHSSLPDTHRDHVAEEQRGAAGIHHVRHAAFEVCEALVENGQAEFADMVGDPRQLVLIPPAKEAQPPDDVKLLRVQEVQRKAPRFIHHVVTVVELVDVDGEPRHRGHDRGTHRRVGDHAVLLPVSDGGNRDDWGCQIAQELVGEVGLEHTSRYMDTPGSLPARFLAHLQQARLFREPGEALVAVSGGADSVALLDLLNAIAKELGLSLVVAHVDHGIQLESWNVGKMVQELATTYGLPFESTELHLGHEATETEARRARYAWLHDVQRRRGAKYVVTAHHEDDQVETIVLRSLRGSAPAGLAGIAARGRGGLVRPLLPFTRRELALYATERGLPVHDDPATRNPRPVRSWIRTTLLPLLNERLGARLRGDLLAQGRHAASDRRAWDRMLDLVPDLALHVEGESFTVARASVCGYDNALSVALLRAAARRVGLVLGPTRAQRIVALAQRPSGRRLPLGDGWSAEVAFDQVRVGRDANPAVDCALERIWPTGERGTALFGGFSIAWSPASAPAQIERATWTTWLDSAAWEVRRPARGDSLVPLGGVGHRPVRRLLMEARVPRSARPRYPVVSRGATILWVPGICRSAAGVPAPGTRAVRLDVIDYGSAQADRRT